MRSATLPSPCRRGPNASAVPASLHSALGALSRGFATFQSCRCHGAAFRAGISLVITSAYRSDAQQARLFEQHPDPRWVAPPGQSLHRCATELDLGPSSAYGWLAANAPRFGFVKRYSWEPWRSQPAT